MTEKEAIAAIARSLYWGYLKDTTGTPGKWSELNEDGRKLWRAMAKRAVRKFDELHLQTSDGPDGAASPPEHVG